MVEAKGLFALHILRVPRTRLMIRRRFKADFFMLLSALEALLGFSFSAKSVGKV